MLAPKPLSPGKLVRNPMSALSLLLNLLWIVFGGLWMAIGWVIAGIVMAITIIDLPWARAAFNIAAYGLRVRQHGSVGCFEFFPMTLRRLR
jgi:hypothetical protein